MQSPFDSIKKVDSEGREWWNSRKLARLMGYMKYWNFERLMDKVAAFLQHPSRRSRVSRDYRLQRETRRPPTAKGEITVSYIEENF